MPLLIRRIAGQNWLNCTPEWENATAAHSNRASAASATQKLKKPYLTLAEELAMPGVKALVDDVTGLDQTLYAWAKKHFGGT